MSLIRCPECGTENDPGQGSPFCSACGKKLPSITDRVRETEDLRLAEQAPSRPRSRQEDDLDDVTRRIRKNTTTPAQPQRGVATILFVITAMQLLCGPLLVFAFPQVLAGNQPIDQAGLLAALAVMLGLAVVYAGLGVWALFMPVPAGIAGLVLYILVFLADLAAAPETASRGIVMKIVIVVLLIGAIRTAWNSSPAPRRQGEDDSY